MSGPPGEAAPAPARLADTRLWGLLAVRGFLAVVFAQAAIDHLGSSPSALADQWAPHGAFQAVGDALRSDPSLYIGLLIAIEFALSASMVVGLLTRVAGLAGLLLNAFFFAAFEWSDRGQLYLSWDASLAALWLVVLLTAPGQYLGLGQKLSRRFLRLGPWIS